MVCPVYGTCGGCSLQNIPHAQQLSEKRTLLANLLRIPEASISIHADAEYGYRNRIDLIIHPDGLAYKQKASQNIVPITECPIADSTINALIADVLAHFPSFDATIADPNAPYKYLVIRSAETSSLSFVLNMQSPRLAQAQDLIARYAQKSIADTVAITLVDAKAEQTLGSHQHILKGDDTLIQTYLTTTFRYSIQGFFQNNHAVAQKMHAYVRERLIPARELLDLYAGIGTFGILNADRYEHVTIVESVKECIDAAKAHISDTPGIDAYAMDARGISTLILAYPLVVITDPPRTGMHGAVISQILQRKPAQIIYISCNPAQLASELGLFAGYRIEDAALFDMFPQTDHMEAILDMRRDHKV